MNEPQEFEDIVFEEVQGKTNDTFIFKFPKLIPTDLCFDCISLYDQLDTKDYQKIQDLIQKKVLE